MFTASNGWRDFCKMQDRVIANIEQDTSHLPYVVNLADDSTRGHIRAADRHERPGRPPQALAKGAAGARLTEEAKAATERLARRASLEP
jgi:hypothetical protein